MARKTKGQVITEAAEAQGIKVVEGKTTILDAVDFTGLPVREPRKVNVQIGFEIEVTVSPDDDQLYNVAKLNDLKREAKDAVENFISGYFETISEGSLLRFKIVNRWY